MMKWFKHQTSAAEELRLARVIRDMGWAGYGMYWVLMERLNRQRSLSVGIDRDECYGYCSKRFIRKRMDRLLDEYGLFVTDERGMVRPASVAHQSDISPTSDEQEESKHSSNARAYIETEKKIEKEKREEEDVFDVEEVVVVDAASDAPPTDGVVMPACPEVSDRREKPACPAEPVRAAEPAGEGEEQSEVRRELAARFGALPCYRHLVAMCDRHTPWAEMVAMQSGYGVLLTEHWEEALLQFVCHALSMDAVSRLATLQDVRSYFMNYARASGPTGRHLKMHLELLHSRQQEERIRNDPYRYEQLEDGVRMVDGRPIPPDAPPRPSPQAYWNDWEGKWQTVF